MLFSMFVDVWNMFRNVFMLKINGKQQIGNLMVDVISIIVIKLVFGIVVVLIDVKMVVIKIRNSVVILGDWVIGMFVSLL